MLFLNSKTDTVLNTFAYMRKKCRVQYEKNMNVLKKVTRSFTQYQPLCSEGVMCKKLLLPAPLSSDKKTNNSYYDELW